MKTILTTFAIGGLRLCSATARAQCCPLASGDDGKPTANPSRVSLFQVPLKCPAAPQIGCGSRAKPILLELERDSNITEAWLNGAGTVLAVVGAESSTRESRVKTVQSLLEK
ncbi:MAG: hypothetical protein HY735_01825 [Verrucomicrobia bacterium]|nr:hypothetical protein [Verrucomicrobiota bacterium]